MYNGTSIFDLKKMILNSQRCKSVNQPEKIYNKSDPHMFFWGASIASIRTVFVDAYKSRYHQVTWHGRKGNRYQEIKQEPDIRILSAH